MQIIREVRISEGQIIRAILYVLLLFVHFYLSKNLYKGTEDPLKNCSRISFGLIKLNIIVSQTGINIKLRQT